MDLAAEVKALNDNAARFLRLGRDQAYRDVMEIIGTASARKDFATVVAEVRALCEGEK